MGMKNNFVMDKDYFLKREMRARRNVLKEMSHLPLGARIKYFDERAKTFCKMSYVTIGFDMYMKMAIKLRIQKIMEDHCT